MSNELAIASVTTTLRDLLTREADATIAGTRVTTRPLDTAREGNDGQPQLNLFLYHTAIDAAWRNMEMPSVRNGESGFPPLPLTLHYLVTAYGKSDDSSDDHRLLGAAMRVLHDHPLLGPVELQARLPESGLFRQVERVRITNQPLSLEEMSKLWTTFQTQYRVSAAYEISVVLIESTRPSGSAPPVILRGVGDVGAIVQPSLALPIPTLESITPDTVLPGGSVTLTGHDLGGDTIRLRFTHPALAEPVLTAPTPAPAGGATLTVPLPESVPAGIATVAALVTRDGHEHPTNDLPLSVRPSVTSALPLQAQHDAQRNVSITVQIAPQVRPGQGVYLLVFGRQIPAEPFGAATATVKFKFAAVAGTTPMRIRVGGTDSELIADTTPPSYHADQQLVVT